jgi:hypothetical protein
VESLEVQATLDESARRWEVARFAWVEDAEHRGRLTAEADRCRREVESRTLGDPEWPLYFVAMSALAWVGNPELFASPAEAIRRGEVRNRLKSVSVIPPQERMAFISACKAFYRGCRLLVLGLEYRFLALVMAILAYPMGWLGGLCLWCIGERENPKSKLYQFVVSLVFAPSFKARHMLFKVLFSLSRRRLTVAYLRNR